MSGPEMSTPPRLGFVAIGRNEGDRLKGCLHSLLPHSDRVVYVDSGSTDGSREFAGSLGVELVDLDTSRGFSMSRARNAGAARLLQRWPDTEQIHFVDGDCEIVPEWPAAALAFLDGNPHVSVVCGRRREKFPARSIFNRICDIEWNTPVGEAASCGGDAIYRSAVFRASGGFNEDLIAGEEPELCMRIRRAGGVVWRIDAEMTRHDANILTWRQWWLRAVRGGYGAADVATRVAKATPQGEPVLFAGQVRSASKWVGGVLGTLALAVVITAVGQPLAGGLLALGVVAVGGLQSLRIALGARKRAGDWPGALWYGLLTFAAKFPQFSGIRRHDRDRRKKQAAKIIEYKQ